GVVGAAVPDPGAVVLDCTGLTGTLSILEGPEPVARVSAGWLGGELERRLETLGLALRHVPQSLESSSVGGWVAHDGFGQLSTRYGGIRDQVVSLRVVGVDGRERDVPPGLYAGSEGTLGVITEAVLRIRPRPRGRRYFAWTFGGPEEAAGLARTLVSAEPPPSVLRAFGPVDRLVHRLGHGTGGSRLKARVERLLLSRLSWLRALAPLAGRRWTLIAVYEEEAPFGAHVPAAARLTRGSAEAPARRWWEKRFSPDAERLRRVFANGCFADTVDLWAPYPRVAELERRVREAVAPYAFAYAHLSHFDRAGACLYVTLAGALGPEAHAAAWRSALEAAVSAGGGVNHHHGIGRAKRPWLDSAIPAGRRAELRSARRWADPGGVLNPWLPW
ncbi:MAG: FAD-binding oxidoreductase, partial [Elusimicrobia bacterium]|nr:FAD-binding oxidoreductase [Elusimicrobiota bacterium]